MEPITEQQNKLREIKQEAEEELTEVQAEADPGLNRETTETSGILISSKTQHHTGNVFHTD